MVVIGNFAAILEALQLIGIVLVEAVVLYFVYGVAENALSSTVIERIKNL